jgi:hypothetical protein
VLTRPRARATVLSFDPFHEVPDASLLVIRRTASLGADPVSTAEGNAKVRAESHELYSGTFLTANASRNVRRGLSALGNKVRSFGFNSAAPVLMAA